MVCCITERRQTGDWPQAAALQLAPNVSIHKLPDLIRETISDSSAVVAVCHSLLSCY